jgi:Helix-turn-helix domain
MQGIATLMYSTAAASSAQQQTAALEQQQVKGDHSCLLTEDEAAKFLRVHPQTLRNWRVAGKGPRALRLGLRRIFYEKTSVLSWRDEQRYVPAPAES